MKVFLDILQQYAGGSIEMLRSLMRGAFTNLSWTDIVDLTKSGTLDSNKVFDEVKRSEQALKGENDQINRYEATAAKRTVTTGEALTAAYENKMIGWGEENIARLFKILEAIRDFWEMAITIIKIRNMQKITPVWLLIIHTQMQERRLLLLLLMVRRYLTPTKTIVSLYHKIHCFFAR